MTDQTGDLDTMEAQDAVDTEEEPLTDDELLDGAALPGDPVAEADHDLEAEIQAVIKPVGKTAAGDDAAADDDDDEDEAGSDPNKPNPAKKSAYMVSQELIDKPLTPEDLMDDGEI
jgi:hypothetical protein